MVGLLDDAGHEVSLAALVQLEDLLALGVAQPLQDHLLGGLGSDAAEVVRGVLPLPHHVAVLVEILAVDDDLGGVGVDCHPRFLGGARGALVGGHQGVGQGVEDHVGGHALLSLEELEGIEQVVVHR